MRGSRLIIVMALMSGAVPLMLHAQRLDPRKALSQYSLTVFQKEEGLPQSTVHGIVQSYEGYLYLTTYKGLARFDGVRFKVFDQSNVPAFRLNGLFALYEASDSTLWIGSNGGGLISYRNGGFKAYTTEDGLANNIVLSVYEDQAGTMWVGTRTGISRRVGNRFEPVDTASQLGRESVLSIVEVRPGELWLGTHNALYRLKDDRSERIDVPQGSQPRRDFMSMLRTKDGEIWIASSTGLLRYSDTGFSEFTTRDGLSDNAARVVYEDRGGTLWVGTINGGLNRMEGNRFTYLDAGRGVSDEQVISILEDREGNLWFGTKRGGLYRLSEGKFLNYGVPEGLPGENINGILQGPDGAIWFGTSDHGLVRMKDGEIRTWGLREGIRSPYVRSLHFVSASELWVGTYGAGITVLTNGKVTGQITARDGLPDNHVRAMLGSREKGIWIGTRNGLSFYKDGKFTNYTTKQGLGTNSILSLEEDPEGGLWIGTDGGGLHRLFKGKISSFTAEQGLSSGVIMNLYYDQRDNCLWIGANNGLNCLKDGKIYPYIFSNGDIPGEVFQILEDDEYRLWLGSNEGIYVVSKRDLYAFSKGKIPSIKAQHLTEVDGMRSGECTPNCYPNGLVTPDGRLWFPTNGGIAMVDTRHLPKNIYPPLFHIDQVWANGETYPLQGTIDLPPGIGKLEIEFAAITFVATRKTHVEYMLEGFDQVWQEAGSGRMASYTNLWPGTYVFRVRGSNNDGIPNEQGASIQLVIRPFLYQTTWFWVLIFLGVGGLVFVAYRVNLKRLQRRNEELEAKVLDRTKAIEEQSEALRQRNETITLLGQVGQEITAKLSQAEVFLRMHKHLSQLVTFDYFGINLFDASSGEVIFAFNVEGSRRLQERRVSIDDPSSLVARCIREQQVLLVMDQVAERKALYGGHEPLQLSQDLMRSRIYLPLHVEDRVLGCITVQHRAPNQFAQSDVEMLQTLAAYAAIAIDNAHAYQQITLAGAEIARQNHLLEERNNDLAKAMEELQSAQARLIVSEKMAALGGLVANIAHEINTPISAVATSARNTQRFLPSLLFDLQRYLPHLDSATLEQFHSLVVDASESPPYKSTRAEREGRRTLKNELIEFFPAPLAEEYSLKLVQMGYRGSSLVYKSLLEQENALDLINLATNLVHLSRNNELIIDTIARTSRIVLALKAYTRLSEEGLRMPVHLGQAIDNVLVSHFEKEMQSGVRIHRQYIYDHPVSVVPEELELVWHNLLQNAFQAVGTSGSITIRIELYQPQVANNGATKEKEVRVTVADTGIGIPKEVLSRIFEPFFTTRPRGEGSGLGLDIAKKIIEKHHGRVEAESTAEGTRLHVYLPQY